MNNTQFGIVVVIIFLILCLFCWFVASRINDEITEKGLKGVLDELWHGHQATQTTPIKDVPGRARGEGVNKR